MNIGDLVEYTFREIVSTGVVLDMSPSGWTVTVLWDDGEVEAVSVERARVINASQ